MAKSEDAIEMFVGGLVLDPKTQAPVVLLKDERGEYCVPIWIGMAEATSIASAIKQMTMPRPLTHDLMAGILNELSVRVERVMITDLKDSTYFAELVLTSGDKAIIMDSRPSDAIALAVRASAPIYVMNSVVNQAKVAFESLEGATGALTTKSEEPDSTSEGDAAEEEAGSEGAQNFDANDRDKWTEILDELDPEDFKYKM
jgi:bifunctional DNase/RNase